MIERIDERDGLAVQKAEDAILSGGLICFKSDTVYGFACDARSDEAVKGLYELKNRPASKSVAIFANDISMAKKIFRFDDYLQDVCDKYLPGCLTIVAKIKDDCEFEVSKNLSPESNFLGFRIINSRFINELIEKIGFPLAVTSANISGLEALLSSNEVYEVFCNSDRDFLLIEAGVCESNGVSTVIRIDGESTEIIRHGLVDV